MSNNNGENRNDASNAMLVDAAFIANRYGIEKKTVRQWGRAGTLPYVKMSRRCVRYPLAECDKIIMALLVPAKGEGNPTEG